ncbi:TonB-dependent receptor domain-containing protein [Zavarzinia sp. CC-PAN008]|uniref:TonB-dependent receptor domain-containing protein n=1 Tax=Zavarzinia sp. CC-PAN008 TaxID=3243332 RepID=UPI003F74AD15
MNIGGRALARMGRGVALAAFVVGFQGFGVAPSVAQGQAEEVQAGAVRLRLAPGSLSSVLDSFSRQSGLTVSDPQGLAAGLSSPGLNAAVPPRDALGRLLAGTGLTYALDGSVATVVPAATGAEAAGAMVLPTLTVSGERVERSVMDSPTSIAVFDEATLERRVGTLATGRGVLENTANVTTTGQGSQAPTVRGIDGTGPAKGGDAFIAGVRPRFNVQVDGRPSSYNEIVYGDAPFWDVKQVEVLRGPQSTIQGRNAIGGAMIVETNDPSYDWEFGGRIIGGNLETFDRAAVVSGPLVAEQLAFRLAVNHRQSRDQVHNAGFEDVADPSDKDLLNVRAKLLIEPQALPGFTTLLTVTHSDATSPQTSGTTRPFEDHTNLGSFQPQFQETTTGGIARSSWEINDQFTLENTFTYTSVGVIRRAPGIGGGKVDIDGDEILVEPLLRYNLAGGTVRGIAAVHYFHNEQTEDFLFFVPSVFEDETNTYAVFGQADISLTDALDLTIGGRYESEHRERVGRSTLFPIAFEETFDAFLPRFGLTWYLGDEWTTGVTIARGFNAGGAGVTFGNPVTAYIYDAEYVWNYEAFGRADLMDGALQLTGNIFFADYDGLQLPFQLGPLSTVIRNAERATTYGVELGARYRVAPGLTVFGDIGVLRTAIEDYPGSGVEGNDLPFSPGFTAAFGVDYEHQSGFDAGIDVRYSDSYFSDVDNIGRFRTDDYVKVNGQVGYTYGSMRVFAYMANIFNDESPLLLSDFGTLTAQLNAPRTWGLGLEAHF